TSSVPEIEIADDADPLRVGRPDHKAHAGNAVELHRMSAKLVVQAKMVAFAEQMEIVVRQDRRESIGVLELYFVVSEAGAQTVTCAAAKRAGEQPGRVDPLKFVFTVGGNGDHATGVRQKHSYDRL